MVVVPLSQSAEDLAAPKAVCSESLSWAGMAAAASLAAGGALLVSGKRRAGLMAAAAGTTLAIIDQKETVRVWWNALPGYLAELQATLGRIQGAVDDLTVQQEKLQKIFTRNK